MDASNDDFNGFGDGFDGFPKRLPEDCVEYSIFIIDSKLNSQKELLARLEAVRKEALKLTDSLLKEYIWQRDGFQVAVESEKGTSYLPISSRIRADLKIGLMYLHGLTNYGDSVEDEWLIVYILRELSNKFPELWIKVVDTDGEFLLIEAANALPRWLNPEIAENRVWIHGNKLRIIPLSAVTPSSQETARISRPLTREEALKTLSSNPGILIHSPLIEAEAFYRLRNYPTQIKASLHHAVIVIPRKLAYILHDRPSSIAPATEAFYLRDPIAMKPLQSKSSKLIFPPEDLVGVSVRFTKVLYAQLKSQQFSPPTVWREKLAHSENEALSNGPKQMQHNRLELGMKVTCGFEMLLSDPKNGDNRTVREVKIILEDLESGDVYLPSDSDIAAWKDAAKDDDESWLDINFEDFERELQGNSKEKQKSGVPGAFGPEAPPGFGDAKTQADLKKMVERFEAFLNDDDAGLDGAEMDEMDVDDDEEDSDDSEDEDKDVSFDENEFAKMMREMMGMPSEEDNETKRKPESSTANLGKNRIEEIASDDEDEDGDEASQIQKVMQRMEAELNEAGALNLDSNPSKLAALSGKSAKETDSTAKDKWEDESDDEDVNIDFNLAKNLLESFKSQAGMPGPGGNIMGMMGMHLPRDEDDESISKRS
ncbi:Ecdysoneless-like protein [Lachnellula hyalina]|uniref:Ecdysoneless-like protein n=1 Tax=Lachnellula hyalina TaxID=1316788 RepID=A0A8H8TYB0_9HELO|nr:Ecdysoneless-like protein [Lachnellula hyalina]TVY26442.1 Ecdysoneless-like protein [Lachnellula hyalina]